MQRVVGYLGLAERGYYPDLQWLYRFIEKRDATLKAVKSRRLAAIKELDWTVKIKEGADPKLAEQQQKSLQAAYDGIANMKEAINFLAMAEFRGFAHLEKHYSNDGEVIRLQPVPQWYWCRRIPSLDWFYNERAVMTNQGVPIDPKNFVIREVEGNVNEIAAISFMRKSLSQKDWDAFVETYGIPPLFVEVPTTAGIPPAQSPGGNSDANLSSGTNFQDLAESVISNGRGVLYGGAKVNTIDAGLRGSSPFRPHLDYQDEQIVLAATSGLLTTLNQATGMGSGQSKNHSDAFHSLARAEALDISEVFQEQFDSIHIDENFNGQETLVYFELSYQEAGTDEQFIPNVKILADAGYEVDLDQMQSKTGYKLTKLPQADLPPVGGPAFKKPDPKIPNAAPPAPAAPQRIPVEQLIVNLREVAALKDDEQLKNRLVELMKN